MTRDREVRNDQHDTVDEYLWPLTGETWPVDWQVLTEELEIRRRLAEILTHVQQLHLEPRLRRLGARASLNARLAATQSVIDGPVEGPVWDQELTAAVPQALREEWKQLGQRLREIDSRRYHRPAPGTAAPR
jgi:hypothetical protein